MDCSTPGFPVYYQFPELDQTHVHATQPSCPLSFPFPPAFNLSQLLGLFQWVSISHQVARILELQLQLNIYLMENEFFKCLKRNSSLRLIIFMNVFVNIWSNLWTIILAFGCSVAKSCLTPCDPMDCSKAGSLVLHYLLEFAQIHVHWVSDAVQPSHPLQSPSSFAFNLCQDGGLLQWVCSLHQVGKVLELQPLSFQWIFRVDFLQDWLVWSPCNPRDSQESSQTTQFKSIDSAELSLRYGSTFTSIHDYGKTVAYTDLCWQSGISAF